MEGNVDALERDGGEAALEADGLGLGFRLFGALLDDFDEVSFDVLDGHLLHEGSDVDLLSFKEVENVGKTIEGTELE